MSAAAVFCVLFFMNQLNDDEHIYEMTIRISTVH